jgi:ABC-type transport system substrate-binding protein
MTRIDRRVLFTSGAAAALLAATGVSAQAAPRRGGRLRAALSGASRTDHWGTSDTSFMQAARGAVFETLTEIAGDGTLRGDIARSWSSDDGGKTWIFNLDTTVVFHDGVALHNTDVVALFESHERLDVTEVSDLKNGQIKVILNVVNQSLPYLLADPQFAVLPIDPERRSAGIGTGFYQVQKFQAGQHFIGTRVSKHRKDDQGGWFDQVEFVSIPSEAVRAEALRTGMVDVADISALDAYSDPLEFQLLPRAHQVQQIANRSITVPSAIGGTWALDNTRMAARWWMA